ncbi:hypothetical protein ACFU7X_06535 [Streptomyces chartreusis]|uniref:hypothetical protein n=1 Tax=Streptomyces chartreusis TaxID=1969 RepID=UPI00369E63CF
MLTGPGTNYATKGQLYNGDRLRVYCGKSNWFYTKLTARSKSGMAKGTAGWVRGDLIWQVS